MRNLLPVTAAAVLLSAFAAQPTRAIDSDAPTATASAPDYSTPTKAVNSLLEAFKAKDSAAIRQCCYFDANRKEGAEILLAAFDASIHLQKAMTKKFGKAGTDALGGAHGIDAALTDSFKAVADAPVTISGDTAVIQVDNDQAVKSASGGKVYFKKVDDQWHIDIGKMLNTDDPQIRQSLPFFGKYSAAMEQTAKDVDDGKFLTVQDTMQAFKVRMIAIAQAARTATAPATQPVK